MVSLYKNLTFDELYKLKGVVVTKYGPMTGVQVKEFENPIPKKNEVRVKILYASLNASDVEIIKGYMFVRLGGGIRKPKIKILGCDFSGVVESIGTNITQFKIGDEVFADLMYHKPAYGALAEYVCIKETVLRKKPANMSFEDACTIAQAGVLAVQGIRGKKTPEVGQSLLINGAGGSVGSFAIQLAKLYGAEVTAVDSDSKFDMLLSLGADLVIDYSKEDFTKNGLKYNHILDVIAKKSVFSYKRALQKNGHYRAVGGTTGKIFQILIIGGIISKLSNKKIGLVFGEPNKKEDIEYLLELYSSGKIKPVIDKIYPMDQIQEAFQYLADGNAKGKVIIKIQ